MTITITIKTDNEAFAEDKHAEIARMLREWMSHGGTIPGMSGYALRDFNGNTVGSVTVRGK